MKRDKWNEKRMARNEGFSASAAKRNASIFSSDASKENE